MTRDFVTESNGRDCKHGRLARSCEICETDQEIASLRAQLEKASEQIRGLLRAVKDAEAVEMERDELRALVEKAKALLPFIPNLKPEGAAAYSEHNRTAWHFREALTAWEARNAATK